MPEAVPSRVPALGSTRPVRRPHKGHRLMTPAKPRPIPRPQAPSPAILAAHTNHPVRIPLADDISAEAIASASAFGAVEGDQVVVIEGDVRTPVGPATAEVPIAPYAKAFI